MVSTFGVTRVPVGGTHRCGLSHLIKVERAPGTVTLVTVRPLLRLQKDRGGWKNAITKNSSSTGSSCNGSTNVHVGSLPLHTGFPLKPKPVLLYTMYWIATRSHRHSSVTQHVGILTASHVSTMLHTGSPVSVSPCVQDA
jgi:hypothetical protein